MQQNPAYKLQKHLQSGLQKYASYKHTHKLVNCSWPNTHDAVEYQSRRTRSTLTGTAYIHSLRRQPHTGYQGPSTAHIATTARGEVRHCRGLWGINICPPSLAVTHHYSYHHQCNVCVCVCVQCVSEPKKESLAECVVLVQLALLYPLHTQIQANIHFLPHLYRLFTEASALSSILRWMLTS